MFIYVPFCNVNTDLVHQPRSRNTMQSAFSH